MAVAAVYWDTTETSRDPARRNDLVARMETARSRIEDRFLEGGAALLSILDVLNKLIGSLDQLAGSLDEETANATMAELSQTIEHLSQLSSIEIDRQARFQEISRAQVALRPHAEDMQETLRYLRTFAVTAKIAGAGIADFAGFAEEILERIQDGTRQVNEFSDRIHLLGRGLGSVVSNGQRIIRNYDDTIPQIVAGLSSGGAQIGKHRKVLMERADNVRGIARGIQGKLASALSAMQIGDITRQRIEHCQSSLGLVDEYLASPDGAALDDDQRNSLAEVIGTLVSLQLRETIDDFDRDTGKIVATVESFRADLAQIDALRRSMAEGDGGESENAMRQLEGGVGAARGAVREIEAVADEASELSRSIGQTVAELVKGIGIVQLVRTDIHYMALNTNLRCSKIGDEGKAINVVAAELRNYAGALDGSADKILIELRTLEDTSRRLSAVEQAGAEGSLDLRLDKAMGNIRAVGDRMDAEISHLSEQSRTAVGDMDASFARLDFKAELGEVLRSCAEESFVSENADRLPGTEAALAELSGRIARLYTMVSERELHAKVMGEAPPAETPAIVSVMSEDDIDDALF